MESRRWRYPWTLSITFRSARRWKAIKKSFDHVDILCNNAGASFGVPNTVMNYDEAAWFLTVDVNLFSVFASRGL